MIDRHMDGRGYRYWKKKLAENEESVHLWVVPIEPIPAAMCGFVDRVVVSLPFVGRATGMTTKPECKGEVLGSAITHSS